MEHRLACLDHWCERFAFFILDALFVDGELDNRCEVGEYLTGILQADRDVVGARDVRKESHERYGILLGETEPVVVVLQIQSA